MTIYQMGIEAVENGVPVIINLKERTMRIGNKVVLNENNLIAVDLGDTMPKNIAYVLERIEDNYLVYRHSIPGKREPSRPWFKALKYDELTDEDRLVGADRAEARFELEYSVLTAILTGKLTWSEPTMSDHHWFWKSKRANGLVILRSWIEPSNK